MSYEAKIRTGIFIAGILSALYCPWWLTLSLIILVLLRFRAWEVLVLAACVDLVYMPATLHWPFFLIASIGIAWALEPLRSALLAR